MVNIQQQLAGEREQLERELANAEPSFRAIFFERLERREQLLPKVFADASIPEHLKEFARREPTGEAARVLLSGSAEEREVLERIQATGQDPVFFSEGFTRTFRIRQEEQAKSGQFGTPLPPGPGAGGRFIRAAPIPTDEEGVPQLSNLGVQEEFARLQFGGQTVPRSFIFGSPAPLASDVALRAARRGSPSPFATPRERAEPTEPGEKMKQVMFGGEASGSATLAAFQQEARSLAEIDRQEALTKLDVENLRPFIGNRPFEEAAGLRSIEAGIQREQPLKFFFPQGGPGPLSAPGFERATRRLQRPTVRTDVPKALQHVVGGALQAEVALGEKGERLITQFPRGSAQEQVGRLLIAGEQILKTTREQPLKIPAIATLTFIAAPAFSAGSAVAARFGGSVGLKAFQLGSTAAFVVPTALSTTKRIRAKEPGIEREREAIRILTTEIAPGVAGFSVGARTSVSQRFLAKAELETAIHQLPTKTQQAAAREAISILGSRPLARAPSLPHPEIEANVVANIQRVVGRKDAPKVIRIIKQERGELFGSVAQESQLPKQFQRRPHDIDVAVRDPEAFKAKLQRAGISSRKIEAKFDIKPVERARESFIVRQTQTLPSGLKIQRLPEQVLRKARGALVERQLPGGERRAKDVPDIARLTEIVVSQAKAKAEKAFFFPKARVAKIEELHKQLHTILPLMKRFESPKITPQRPRPPRVFVPPRTPRIRPRVQPSQLPSPKPSSRLPIVQRPSSIPSSQLKGIRQAVSASPSISRMPSPSPILPSISPLPSKISRLPSPSKTLQPSRIPSPSRLPSPLKTSLPSRTPSPSKLPSSSFKPSVPSKTFIPSPSRIPTPSPSKVVSPRETFRHLDVGFRGGGFRTRRITQRFKPKTQFKPSLTALVFGITAKKAPRRALTGLEIRPVVPQFKPIKRLRKPGVRAFGRRLF